MAYNLSNPSIMTWRQYISLIKSIGYSISTTDYHSWVTDISKLEQYPKIQALSLIYSQEASPVDKWHLIPIHQTQEVLANLKHSEVTFDYIKICCAFLERLQFLPQPVT